jgi:D-beta-D-heptose 7-phosphate kinase/D-beta-D-heptose 1-phosphate adenosyltransferase
MKIWINGTFDIIHAGHIKLFKRARILSGLDGWVKVGADTDQRITGLKGQKRPINKLEDRIEVLRSIKWIDEVVTFSNDLELEELIKDFSPDILLIGSDYKDKKIIGDKWVGEILFFERYSDLSSTKIIQELEK